MKKTIRRSTALAVSLCLLLLAACTPSAPDLSMLDEGEPSAQESQDTGAAGDGEASQAPVSTERGGVGDGQYKEAPMLAELVASGDLPPIEERLPDEPYVVEVDEIGIYGGTYRGAAFGPTSGQVDTEALRFQSLLTIEKDLRTFKPNLIKDYTINEDSTEFVLYLREGMKWSSGDPLTADDFLFWYECINNQDICPAYPTEYLSGDGSRMEMEKVSDYEVKLSFSEPNPAFEIIMATKCGGAYRHFFAPKEYLKQFHPDYNPDAEALAAELGYSTWTLCFQEHLANDQTEMDVNCPSVFPWVLSDIDSDGNKTFARNPYYHVVDQEGNQLPYIDNQLAYIVQDAQMRTLKLISGELHAAGENPLPVSDYTLYKENEENGDYRVFLFDNTRGSDCAFSFNITDKDPVLREIFNDLSFRQAMSLAINRDEINDTLYYGRANVRQATASPDVSFYEEWMGDYLTEYDPDRANQLLDEAGYGWNSAGTVRLMPDGNEFNLVLETIEEFIPVSEMVTEYWNAVGIKTNLQQQERTYYLERGKTNDRNIQAFTMDSVAEFNLRANSFSRIRPGGAFDDLEFMQAYKDWFDDRGGEEPPQEIKDLYDDCLRFSTLRPEDPEYAELGNSILTRTVEKVWMIGVSVSPRVVIISNSLGNTPDEGTFANDYNFWKPYRGDTWYFKY